MNSAAPHTLAPNGAGFAPRHANQRRIKYGPIWDIQEISADAQGPITFFAQRASDPFVTNSKGGGQQNVYKSFLLKRVLFLPMLGTSLVDFLRFLNRCRFDIEVQDDTAISQLQILQQPGIGVEGVGLPSHGSPITGMATDFGDIALGGGVEFGITIHPPRGGLKNVNAFQVRCALEGLIDGTKG